MITHHDPRRPIILTEAEVQEASALPPLQDAVLVLRLGDGTEATMPAGLARLVLQAVTDIADHRRAEIALIPEVLPCSSAARLIGLRRPDLLKLHAEGNVPAHHVAEDGEPYFRRDDVLDLHERRVQAQRRAFEELRALYDELGIDE